MKFLKSLLFVLIVTAPAAAEPPPGAVDGEGGLANLSADDVAALRGARQWLKETVLDRSEPPATRHKAMQALARVHEALADWGTENQADWYFQTLMNFDSDALADPLLGLAESSAKGPVYHLAGVHAFWHRMEAATGGSLPGHLQNACNRFHNMTRAWTKPPSLTAGLQTLKTSTVTLDPPRMIAPLRAAPYQLDPPRMIAPRTVAPQRIDLSKVLTPYPDNAK